MACPNGASRELRLRMKQSSAEERIVLNYSAERRKEFATWHHMIVARESRGVKMIDHSAFDIKPSLIAFE